MSITRSLTGFTLILGLLATAGAHADETNPGNKHTPYSKDSVAVNINPNRFADPTVPSEGPAKTATRLDCGLSAHEELLVSELRSSLERLEDRRLQVAAKEAALNNLHAQVIADLTELRRLQGNVGGQVTKVENALSQFKAEHKRSLFAQRDQQRRLMELKEAQSKRAAQTHRLLAERRASVNREQTIQAADLERLETGQVELTEADQEQASSEKTAAAAKTAETKAAADRKTRIAQLAGILKKMRPGQAAGILAKQPTDVAVGVLEALGARLSSKIMAALSPESSARLTRQLIERPVGADPAPTGKAPTAPAPTAPAPTGQAPTKTEAK
ncbi:MAG: flagellar motility protein MotE (MotC chaperone) [Myxococcota bacterium]|jgi:flagellar motility protein MotE (MotC chaperone)